MAYIWVQFIIATVIILGSSKYLARSADIIAYKTGLGRTFIGVVLLASATSLPELGIGVSSITMVGSPDLAAGDAFGSNLVNLLIIGLMDLYWRNGPILNSIGTSTTLVGILGILVIGIAAIAITFHQGTTLFGSWLTSPFSIVLFATFLFALYIIFCAERTETLSDNTEYDQSSLRGAIGIYSLTAVIIVASAVWLAFTGDHIADQMKWEESFVGTQFLAFSTSLPELAASFAALRLRAPELAISNVLGSNLFNMGFVLWIDELAYTSGSLWTAVSGIHVMTAIIAIVMTVAVIVALLTRGRQRPSRFWTYEAILLILLYVFASWINFFLVS
tara:strand:- start:5441 stop:6439 length:999 start_codon:yes stop_codon:yes gene_type:complete